MKRFILAGLLSLLPVTGHAQALISDGSDMIHKVTEGPVVMTMTMTMKMKEASTKIGGLMTAVIPDDASNIVTTHEAGKDWRADVNIMRHNHKYLVFGVVWIGRASMAHDDQPDKLPVPIIIRDSFALSGQPHIYNVKNTPVYISFDVVGNDDDGDNAAPIKGKSPKPPAKHSDDDE